MGWMAPGEYEVKFSKDGIELSSKTVTVVKMDDIEEEPTTPNEPSVVVFKSVKFDEDGKVEFSWNKLVNDFVGYRIYYSETASLDNWKLALDETLLTASISKLASNKNNFFNETNASTLYFKIVGVNKNVDEEIEGKSSKIYSILSADGNKNILVVDGFDRRVSVNSFSNHTLSASYISSLSKLSFVSSAITVDNSSIIDGSVNMIDYDVVLWISGEESTTDETFNSTEQSKVKSFLEAGGKLVVSGAELGWDLGRSGKSSVADVAFYTDYLKSVYKNDGSTSFGSSVGTSGIVFDGVSVVFNNANGWEVEFPDGIDPVTGAELLMDYASGGYGSAIGYLGAFGLGEVEGGIVHFAFPIGATVQSDVDVLISKSFEYLQVSALSNDDYFADQLTVYPNPVREFVAISGLEFNQEFDVTVYSTVGKVVYQQYVKSEGDNISINTSSWNKGIYVLEIRHENSKVVKKLLKQ
ncbi:MAG: T9SS type A sorting domain-containing protein, partial [Mycoplasmataceae bacterium]|nr:T9SS type A sorting domain-containing protein [Mycoplasmataceae bacterium]